MRNFLFLIILAFLINGAARASQPLKFTELVTDSSGRVQVKSQAGAALYCITWSSRYHLPTARDFAQYAQSMGAQGIKELDQFANESEANRAGYYLIKAQETYPNEIDSFYYSRAGYRGSQPYYDRIWASSVNPNNHHDGFYFDIFTGNIGRDFLDTERLFPFRCLVKD